MKNILLTGAFQYSEEQKKCIVDLGFDVDFQQHEKDIVNNASLFMRIHISYRMIELKQLRF